MDQGRGVRVFAADRDGASGESSHGTDVHLESLVGVEVELAMDGGRHEVVLDVGVLDSFVGSDEATGLEVVGGTHS